MSNANGMIREGAPAGMGLGALRFGSTAVHQFRLLYAVACRAVHSDRAAAQVDLLVELGCTHALDLSCLPCLIALPYQPALAPPFVGISHRRI